MANEILYLRIWSTLYRRTNLRSGLDASLLSGRKVFPKKRREDERERERGVYEISFEEEDRGGEKDGKLYFVFVRRHVSKRRDSFPFAFSRRLLTSLASYDLPPCRIFSLSGPSFHSLRSGIYEIRRPICQSFMCQNTLSYWRRVYDVCYDVAFIPILPAFPLSKRREKGCI